MIEELFDVVFFGILQPGKDKDTVMANMATLFKTEASKLAPFFAGGRKVIKGKLNAAAAEKYKTALENVGLVIKIESCEAAEETETAKNNETQENTESGGDSISIAPVGADVIENPVETPAQEIGDISDISMADVGADVLENPIQPPAQKIADFSDLSMAEAGSDVLEHPVEVIPQKIEELPELSLAEAGADMIENPKPKEKAKIPDTSELSLDDEKV